MRTALSEQIATMEHGDHFCLFYRDEEEQIATTIPFISQGLERRERCIYFGDGNSVRTIARALTATGVDVGTEVARGALLLDSGRDYLVDGKFDPDRMVGLLEGGVEATREAGFAGWRATGDTHWEIGPEVDYETLIRYEEVLDLCFEGRPMVGICQQDLRLMPPQTVEGLFRTHRKAIVEGVLQDSVTYRPFHGDQHEEPTQGGAAHDGIEDAALLSRVAHDLISWFGRDAPTWVEEQILEAAERQDALSLTAWRDIREVVLAELTRFI
jgi:hypothetical protein